MTDVDSEVTAATGPAAPPRKNGELVFNAPWEGRAFGMALALRSIHPYPWRDFQKRLEVEIAAAGAEDDGSGYYQRWVAAFEGLLADRGLLDRLEVERRTQEYMQGEREEVF